MNSSGSYWPPGSFSYLVDYAYSWNLEHGPGARPDADREVAADGTGLPPGCARERHDRDRDAGRILLQQRGRGVVPAGDFMEDEQTARAWLGSKEQEAEVVPIAEATRPGAAAWATIVDGTGSPGRRNLP